VCWSVLQCFAVRCSALQCVAVYSNLLEGKSSKKLVIHALFVLHSMLQCVQCVTVRYSELQCVAMCPSGLQCKS